MRKSILFWLIGIVVLTGCVNEETAVSSNTATPTIFGRLSQIVQIGGTEETIAYKLPVEDYYVTLKGEVLTGRPAYIDITVMGSEDGKIQDDLLVTLEFCHTADEMMYNWESCLEHSDEMYHHQLETTWANGVYRTEPFAWERSGVWAGTLSITSANSSTPQVISIYPEIYPTRPPSTNLFELGNISLPFVVIFLFLGGVRLFRGRLIQAPTAVENGLT